tara:strand:- start:4219 stop:4749 length:531 start_codon:yes stop_codon:yes gene_type:complete
MSSYEEQLKEEQLKEELQHTKDCSWDYYTELLKLKEENKKLKEENQKIGELVISQTDKLKEVSIKYNAGYNINQKLQEENKKLKEEIVKLKAQNAKIKKSEKYVVNLWKQEQDAHSKTLNNIFKNLNLTEEHRKSAQRHADQFDNSKNPEGQYRTMIGNWYWVCYKAISSSSVPHQ